MSMNALFTEQFDSLRFSAPVVKVEQQTDLISTIYFERPSEFTYQAGQYITVFFDDTNVTSGKAYSLSSAPQQDLLSITVKKIGLFSGKLHVLRPGQILNFSSSYGTFNAFGAQPLVCLAAGVGIAPIFSILKAETNAKSGRKLALFYSNCQQSGIAFESEILQLAQINPNLEVNFLVTRQPDSDYFGPRLRADKIAANFAGYNFCICGAVEFVRTIRQQLLSSQVDERQIATEVFFEAN